MFDDESYKDRLDYMRGQIETLEQIIRITLATMSIKQREFVYDAAWDFARRSEERANEKDTDPARDRASAIYEIVENLTDPQDCIEYYKWKSSRR